MSPDEVELNVQRRMTTAFIRTQPVEIVLKPRELREQPSGGTKWADLEPRPSQTLRLVEPSNPARPIRTADGIEREVEFMLLGEHTADIGVYDVFEHAGGRWEVIFLYHFNGWERRAEVARHG